MRDTWTSPVRAPSRWSRRLISCVSTHMWTRSSTHMCRRHQRGGTTQPRGLSQKAAETYMMMMVGFTFHRPFTRDLLQFAPTFPDAGAPAERVRIIIVFSVVFSVDICLCPRNTYLHGCLYLTCLSKEVTREMMMAVCSQAPCARLPGDL